MKAILLIALSLFASQTFALSKCVIDGKTVYQSGPCVNGEEKKLEGSVSSLSSEGLRNEIAAEKLAIQQAEELERQRQQEELARRQANAQNEKIDELSRRISNMQRQQQADRIHDNFQKIIDNNKMRW